MIDTWMTLPNHCVSPSLCYPSRAATLCGQYAHNNSVFITASVNSDSTKGGYILAKHSSTEALKIIRAAWTTIGALFNDKNRLVDETLFHF